MLIGDPKQAIYRFRGADINTYLKAAHQSQEQHRLDTNWRSSVSIVEAVNHLFRAKESFSQDESIRFFLHCPVKRLRTTLFCGESARSRRADLLLIQVRQATSEHLTNA